MLQHKGFDARSSRPGRAARYCRFTARTFGKEAKAQGWDLLKNGELLDAAEAAGFELLLTTDENIRYQQNLAKRKIAIVVLGKGRWRLIKPVVGRVVAAVNAATPGSYTEVDVPGR